MHQKKLPKAVIVRTWMQTPVVGGLATWQWWKVRRKATTVFPNSQRKEGKTLNRQDQHSRSSDTVIMYDGRKERLP